MGWICKCAFLYLTQKNIVIFCTAQPIHVLLLTMLLYCHKIGEYINKDHSKKVLINKGRVTNKQCRHLSKNRRAKSLWKRVLQFLLQQREGHRSKAQGSCSFLSKEPLSKGATDMNEMYCWICNLSLYSFILWYIFQN